jgi:hypothetical protein
MYGSGTQLQSFEYCGNMSDAVLAEFICAFATHLWSPFTGSTISSDVTVRQM